MNKGLFRKGLVLGIIVLFVGAGVIPSTVGIKKEKTSNTAIISSGYIQDLIDNASDDDTIYIPSGTYYENIVINKSISLIGEDKNTTVINGLFWTNVVKITADWVNISGFTLQNSSYGYGNDAGIHISSSNNTIRDNIIMKNGVGIEINTYYNDNANYNTITDNNILNNFGRGIEIYFCEYNIISNNKIENTSSGIIMMGGSTDTCSNNTISYNFISLNLTSHNLGGISLIDYCNDNLISYNTIFSDNKYGLTIGGWKTKNNTFVGNTLFGCGFFVEGCFYNYFENNFIDDIPLVYLIGESDVVIDLASQVFLIDCDNITIQNSEISNVPSGIFLINTNNCTIYKNFIDEIFRKEGIYLINSSNNIIKENTIISNVYGGISIESSNSNTIKSNNILNGGMGLSLNIWCENNSIENNNISNNSGGVSFRNYCNNNIIMCNNILKNKYRGISFSDCNDNTIMDNNIFENIVEGIFFFDGCYYNTIMDNDIYKNERGGIIFRNCNDNDIIGNNISSHIKSGIYIYSNDNENYCKYNKIMDNNIFNNNYSVRLGSYTDATIVCHNNFINNTNNAIDESDNMWDGGKFGNYWSDYKEKYPNATKKPLKGIWDTPYEIEGGDNADDCPLINQWPKSRTRTITRTQTTVHPIFHWFLERFPMLERLLTLLLL